jgi:hypothetical protein
MPTFQRDGLVSRDAILTLLSDQEVARVSTAEAATSLIDGQEYIDLENLGLGVQRTSATSKLVMGHLVPREAVSGQTWAKILALVNPASK